jgi:hypothetical protein
MAEYTTLAQLPPASRRRIGMALIAVALALAATVTYRPEAARVPLWVLWSICSGVALAGVAVAAYTPSSPPVYRWSVVGVLASMFCVPAWIAFGPGSRSCTSNFAAISSETSCRVAFGVGAALLAVMLVIALRQALNGKNAA